MNIDISNVTAIVVAYQSSHVIERCLDNLTSIKKIVIDNSSDLVLKKKLLNKYKDIKVIHPKSNLGFGSANNLGILIAETDYVLCLNPDVIFEEKYLLNLVEIYSTYENVGLVSPQVFDHNDNSLFEERPFQKRDATNGYESLLL